MRTIIILGAMSSAAGPTVSGPVVCSSLEIARRLIGEATVDDAAVIAIVSRGRIAVLSLVSPSRMQVPRCTAFNRLVSTMPSSSRAMLG